MLVAPELREFADLSRDVMLLGMGSFLELWDKRRYAEHEAQVVASPMPDSIKNFTSDGQHRDMATHHCTAGRGDRRTS